MQLIAFTGKNMPEAISVYVHIPFCQSICTYCAFNTYTGMNSLFDAYVEAVVAEIAYIGRQRPDWQIRSVFFGGGTPSVLSAKQLGTILDNLHAWFSFQPSAEITLEANPNDLLELAYLQALRRIGVNRLSIGMQSATTRDLRLFERRHDVAMVEQAFAHARAAGFTNISLDLMYGIPDQTLDEWEQSLTFATDLRPEHLSFYGLELKGGTVLTKAVKQGLIAKPDDDLAADMYEFADAYLQRKGYQQYEISNWSLEGFEGQHNLQYWRNAPYWGIGAGAHGYLAGVRTIGVRLPQRYISLLQARQTASLSFPRTPATAKASLVSRDSEMAETMMMGLRLTREGVQREAFYARFGVHLHTRYARQIARFTSIGMMVLDDVSLRLLPPARLISNAVIREFI